MLEVVKMKEACRICARELCGNQRRWIFHPGAKLSLQVLLAHVLGRELGRDGRGEFACSKCVFMLDRMYRFDTVIARVEALSLERLHRLVLERDRLRHCIGGLYRKNNPEDREAAPPGPVMRVVGAEEEPEDPAAVDLSVLQEARYSDMIQDDLTYSVHESWAGPEVPVLDQHQHLLPCPDPSQKQRRCRGCAALRVADSDYEAVCKVPRRVGRRSTSCGPSTRYSATSPGAQDVVQTSGASDASDFTSAALDTQKSTCEGTSSPTPASSVESLDTTISRPPVAQQEHQKDPEQDPFGGGQSQSEGSGPEMLLGLLRGWGYRPVKLQGGSRIPVLLRTKLEQDLLLAPRWAGEGSADFDLTPQPVPALVSPGPRQDFQAELVEMEEEWLDDYVSCEPLGLQEKLLLTSDLSDPQIEEQQDRLSRYQTGQVGELQAKIRQGEARTQKLQERLANMALDLQSAQEEAQRQDRTIQNLSDSIGSKEKQVAELAQVIQEQTALLCSPDVVARHSQLQGSGPDSVQQQVLGLQASLFQAQLELQAGQRAQRQAARTQQNLDRAVQRLESDLQGALQHRRDAERHNQDLQLALEKVRSALLEREERLEEAEQQWRQRGEEQELSIRALRASLLARDQQREDGDLLEGRGQVQKLRLRIRDRDRALERSVDEKFRCLKEKEEESRGLQLLLREQERDVERQRCVLTHNEETITSLEVLLRARALELEQVRESSRSLRQQLQDIEQRHRGALKERDAIISQLQVALQAHAQESQVLRCSLLPRDPSAPNRVLEELKLRLQLKDRLFQDVLADRARQAQEHQEQVQDLLRTIRSRDQYLQDSASRLGEVMTEQTTRLQELRQQLSSGGGWTLDREEVQALKEEVQAARQRSKENQELSRTQAAMLESLSGTLHVKEALLRDLQRKLAEPSDLPLVEQLTQELQELRESLVQQGGPPARGPVLGRDQAACGDTNSEEGDSQCADEDESRSRVQMKDGVFEGGGLTQLLQQKTLVEKELWELKAQLEKAGFTSLSQMRNALIDIQAQKTELRHQLQPEEQQEPDDEGELDVAMAGAASEGEEEMAEMWDTWDGQISLSNHTQKNSLLRFSSPRVDPNVDVSATGRRETVVLQPRSKDLQERLEEQQELLAEATVQQDSKLIQVDLQDLGYETCGRSENEAEREDTSSPEFDDLEMCTSLDCAPQWWAPSTSSTQATSQSGDSSLRRLVQDLRSQLSGSQALVRDLRAQLRSLSSSKDLGPSPLRKVNWCLEAASQSGAEEDEGWQSSSDGPLASPRRPGSDRDLRDLVSRVDALEDQLREGGKKPRGEDRKCPAWPGKFDSLIQTQARDLSHLRQRVREARGVCNILTQHLGDTTKAFEELLRSNDIDFYMGQSFREQLAQSGALVQRVSAKISGPGDDPEDPEEKTELLAIRLSKELQQKDKIIESLQAQLNQHQRAHGSDTPCSSHALSDATDQLDRISYVSEDRGSTAEDLELCSEVEATSELHQRDADLHAHLSAPPSVASSHQSWLSCPSMQFSSSPQNPTDVQSRAGFPAPHTKPLQGFPSLHQPPPSFHQPSLFSGALDVSSAMNAGAGLLESSALWDVPYCGRPARLAADVSSGSSGYQSGTSHTGSDLMKEHLREIRSLRQRLEETISTNERLRQQLEDKLAHTTTEKGGPTNIYIQGLDSVAQLSSEVRSLKEENISLQNQLKQAGREGSKEAELLKEAVLLERAKSKEAELEAERLSAQSRKQQSQAEANGAEIVQLKHERQKHQEAVNRLQHEVSVLQQQLCESRRVVRSLQVKVCAVTHTHTAGTSEPFDLTFDPLVVTSGQQDIPPPVRDTGLIGPDAACLLPSVRCSGSIKDGAASGGSSGRRDLNDLRQQLSDARSLLCEMEARLFSMRGSQELHLQQPSGSVSKLLSDTKRLQQILEEAGRFWRAAAAPTLEPESQDQALKDELTRLRRRLSEQDQALKEALETVKRSNRTKDSLENLIVGQLARTRDVLKKAKTNLQTKSLGDSGSSASHLTGAS
uniref:Si:ch211-242b18.1 n=1 Tax=Takifugu rubripes TaxID=31033 RepID=H2S702_TAKRU